jgi:hypothetical protein
MIFKQIPYFCSAENCFALCAPRRQTCGATDEERVAAGGRPSAPRPAVAGRSR